jgi:hypothetical protein
VSVDGDSHLHELRQHALDRMTKHAIPRQLLGRQVAGRLEVVEQRVDQVQARLHDSGVELPRRHPAISSS